LCRVRQPIGVITKSALIRRDIDVLQQLARDAHLGVFFTILLPIVKWREQLSLTRLCPRAAFMRWQISQPPV